MYAAALVVVLANTAPAADIIHVPADRPTINLAVDSASDGDVIVVAAGDYFEHVDFDGKSLEIRAEDGPTQTSIRGNGLSLPIVTVVGSADARLEGFTIDAEEGMFDPPARGGGLFIENSVVSIAGCVITGNRSEGDDAGDEGGAGVYCRNSAIMFSGCEISNNEALTGSGAAIRALDTDMMLDHCVLSDNVGNTAGILLAGGQAYVSNSRFEGNDSDTNAGAVQLIRSESQLADMTMTASVVVDCNATGPNGVGGAFFVNEACSLIADGVHIENCTASIGGAFYIHPINGFVEAASCLIVGNHATDDGGGAFVGHKAVITNCTFVNNTSDRGAGETFEVPAGAQLDMRNCIVVGQAPTHGGGGLVTHYFCNVEDAIGGEGNFFIDPGFVDEPAGDFRLALDSPCIDAGDTNYVLAPAPTDLDGAPRAVDDPATRDTGKTLFTLAVDVGAYELQVGCLSPCDNPADFNCDGVLDILDFIAFHNQWVLGCP